MQWKTSPRPAGPSGESERPVGLWWEGQQGSDDSGKAGLGWEKGCRRPGAIGPIDLCIPNANTLEKTKQNK